AGTEYLDNSGNIDLFFGIDNANNVVRMNAMNSNPVLFLFNGTEMFRFTSSGMGIGGISPANPIQHSSGAILTAGGVWQNASSRALKENICDLDADAAMDAFRKLEPVTYTYKVDPKEHHVGFIAEDVPEIVAAKDHKSLSPLDIVALLTKVVQQQQQTIDELSAKVSAMEKKQ
ncbi:MAG TPA: tail fiber domain-containing protein, partial [Thermoanaerobaculia bacterium]|nr:tail fiber domain-containing protein [Thermoanaerobaculia bacterium]